jgi:UDP-N-acetylmuramate-alanine ligase
VPGRHNVVNALGAIAAARAEDGGTVMTLTLAATGEAPILKAFSEAT